MSSGVLGKNDLEETARKKEEVLLLWRDLSMELVLLDVASVCEKMESLS